MELRFHGINLNNEFGGDVIEGLQGHPSLERLDFGYITLESVVFRSLGKVLAHPKSKLRHFSLPEFCNDERLEWLCDALIGSSSMKRLCLMSNKRVTTNGWKLFSTFLHHPKCKLTWLDMCFTDINDEGINILGSALKGTSVIVLNLSNSYGISIAGWRTLFNKLSQASVKRLDLKNNKIDDDGLAALASIRTLTSLDLTCNTSSKLSGWQSFFNSLQSRGAQLVKLELSNKKVDIGNGTIQALGSLLRSMSTLKILKMKSMYSSYESVNISSQDWVSLFNSLQGSNLNLVELDLSGNNIDDEGIQLLIRLVSCMSSLKYLNLRCNQLVESISWLSLTGYLQSPNFALEELILNGNKINDDNMVALTSALVNNNALKRLSIDYCTDDENINDDWDENDVITERGLGAIAALLCNESNIMSTYNSNHTLWVACQKCDEEYLPDDLVSLLRINANKDKVEVARQKILQTHFSVDSTKIQEFLDMELEVMPAAIDWMGRPTHDDWSGTNLSGLSLLYNLLKRLPDLLDSDAHKKTNAAKRKRIV